jgi:hypothetical protein
MAKVRYELKIAGFASSNCQTCYGTGRMGFLGPMEKGLVQPCPCVAYFEVSKLKQEAAKPDGQQEQ